MQATQYSKELLDVDEAAQCLGRNNLQALIDAQKHAVDQLETKHHLIAEYTAKTGNRSKGWW